MPDPDLVPDCRNCDALCCVLPSFDASAEFAVAKPACVACRNLSRDNSCCIHSTLADQGIMGCVAYSCYGAGQRLKAEVFRGGSWRSDAALLPALDEAFRPLRDLHEAAFLLQAAARLPLPPGTERQRQDLLAPPNFSQDWTPASLRSPMLTQALTSVRSFLAGLRDLPEVRPPHP